MKLIKCFALLYTAIFVMSMAGPLNATGPTPPPTEAPAGVDNLTADPVTANQAQHLADQQTFEEVDGVEKGLGPVFNMRSCVACHQQPVTGGISQVSELRAGSIVSGPRENASRCGSALTPLSANDTGSVRRKIVRMRASSKRCENGLAM